MKLKNLDLLDRKVINVLNKDPRASYASIARRVRSSKEVVGYRVKRLVDSGVIAGFVTVFGFGYWPYKMLVQLENVGKKEEKEIVEYLVNNKDVCWVTTCSGNWDIAFAVIARDPSHFDSVLRRILKNIGKYVHDYKMATTID